MAKPWVVTHASRYENFTNKSGTYTKTMDFQHQVSAGVTFTSTVAGTVGSNTLIGQLEAKTGMDLHLAGAKTSTATQSRTFTMQPGGATVFYGGTRRASGNWTLNRCVSPNTLRTSAGRVTSWDVYTEGGVFCRNMPPATSLAYRAKQLYC